MIEDPDRDEPTTDDRPSSRPWLATTLAVLCALTLIGGLVLVFWLHDRTEEIDSEAQDRADVVEAAEEFTAVWNTFRPKDAATYVERVAPLLTSKFAGEFTNAADDVVTGITQQRLSSKGEVLEDGDGAPLIGIASIDQDSAEVLVVADANRVSNQQRVVRHWRWQVSMRKVDGKWLVDSFKEV